MTLSQKKTILSFSAFSFLILLFFLFLATHVLAATEFQPLVGLPGLEGMNGNTDIPKYINALYLLSIGIGALIGVVKISIAGVKYSLSDIVTDKASAKSDIMGVLMGLAILLVPFLVLNTIYPNLTNLDVLKGAGAVKVNLNKNSTATERSAKEKARKVLETIVFDEKTTCESKTGNVYDPTTRACSAPVSSVDTCPYNNEEGKATCLSRCSGGTTQDTPNRLAVGQVSGSIKCTTVSRSGMIPR